MEEFAISIFKFSHLLIRGLIKGLSINQAIYSTLSRKIHNYIVHDSSAPWVEFSKSILKFSHQLIRELIKGLSPN